MKKLDVLYRIIPLFLKTGYKVLTMDEIAGSLSISKKTIYNLFTNKADLITIVNENFVDFFVQLMKSCEPKASNAIEFAFILRAEAENVMSLMDQRSFLLQAEQLSPKVKETTFIAGETALRELSKFSIEKAAREGYVNPHIDIETNATIFATNYINILVQTPFESEEELVHTFVRWYYMHLRGIYNNKGNQIMDEYIAAHPELLS